MKKICFTLLLAYLTACSSVTIPSNAALPQTATAAIAQYPNQDDVYTKKITQPINKIIAHFDENNELVSFPADAGYYRVHLGNLANGDAVIQDFYEKTKTI